MRPSRSNGSRAEFRVDETDLSIIRCLQKDARGSLTKVADALNLPESTVRNRFNRLVDLGLIEFALVNNPLKFGFPIWTVFEIIVQPAKLRSVSRQLAELDQIHLVAIMMGDYDIYASALFRNNADMVAFMTGPIAKISGISAVRTSSMLEVVKRNVTFGIPEEGGSISS